MINQDLVFQILDWDYFHDEDEEGKKQFCIQLFGRTKDQKTVYLRVNDFQPYFYVELNPNWNQITFDRILEAIKSSIKKEKDGKEKIDGLLEYKIEKKYRFWGFTNYTQFKFARLQFTDYDSMKAYSRAFSYSYKIYGINNNKPTKFKLYESNIIPFFRFMHIRQLEAVGWVSIAKEHLEQISNNETCCNLNYETTWKQVNKVEDRLIEKFTIAAFDIECTSEDGSFPQPQRDGDKVIQIGITLSRFGEDECFYKHLLSLGKTGEIEGATVESFETEAELLLGFTKIIRKLDPDIVTGYNIFGFDFNYLKERSVKLGISHKFSRLSRITNENSEWCEKELASAALGSNILKFYKMRGRVLIDIMKVVQRDYKLSGYKLDYVASQFIREKVKNFESGDKTFKINTKNTFGLRKHQYITLCYIDGSGENKYNDGQKFKVIDLGKDFIIVEGKINDQELKGLDVVWTQAKDDISPNDIFEKFKGNAKDRAIIGKYCLMDCELCNKLMAKLQIITNNVSMANVCNVPLTYLFLRGQGVKIFSLVSKKCREKNHLVPVIQKKQVKKDEKKEQEQKKQDDKMEKFIDELNNKGKDLLEDDDDGYEGAIVFIPKPKVWYEPIGVLDFASLYPNSMILRNLSHECWVNDPTYDNLPGYRYHQISYKNNDGTISTCRFAEKLDGTKGIIPEILNDLLSARKKYKKLMEEEKDPFKKSILDALQLAYKITANSLYGQCGGSTSPIHMKEIAASTTATGREMLQFSKYFIENMYTQAINLALTDKAKYLDHMRKIYEYYPNEFNVVNEKNEDVTIHINTDLNMKIPDNKFFRPFIGYDIDNEFNKFPNLNFLFETIKVKNEDTKVLNKKIVEQMGKLKLNDRDELYQFLKTYMLEKTGKASYVFDKFKTLWNTLEITDHEKLREQLLFPLRKLDDGLKLEFLDKLNSIIDNLGYANKDEFFEKFYNTVNQVLKGYHVDSEVIYGDSVTGDTPLLLRRNHVVIIDTIENIGKTWKEYHGDKFEDSNINDEVWTDLGWTKIKRVIKHETNKQIYQVLTHTGCVNVTEDHSLLNKDGHKIKPHECEIGTELLHSFPQELWESKLSDVKRFKSDDHIETSYKYHDYEHHIECHGQLTACHMYYMLKSLYYFVSIDSDKPDVYKLTYTGKISHDNNTKIKKITKLEKKIQIVYDLETENHHFHAGVGELIVHNTDSVFFCPHFTDNKTKEKLKDKKALEMAIIIGIWGSIMICSMLPAPMAQEYEKCLYPFIIQGKKRYVGNLYEKDPNHFKQKSMGIELKRRDNAQIVKVVCAGIIDQILNKHSSEGAYKFTKQALHNIITGKYKFDKFVITKTLKGNALTKDERKIESAKPKEKRSYADRSRIVHAVLADRMADRDPGNKPISNDRIPYMYIEMKKEPKLQGDKVETPEYIIKNNLKIDYLFYITNQIEKPALKFLDLIIDNAENIFNEYIIKEENRKKCMMPIVAYHENNHDKNNIKFDDLKVLPNTKKIKKIHKEVKKPIESCPHSTSVFGLLGNNDNIKFEKPKKLSSKKKPKLKIEKELNNVSESAYELLEIV